MLLRGQRSRCGAVHILASEFANPLTQRRCNLVARARGRADRASPRGGLRWPASRIRGVATLSPRRRAISENARARRIASVYARSQSVAICFKIVDFMVATGRSRHNMRVGFRENSLPLEPLEHVRLPNRAIVCAFAIGRALLRIVVFIIFAGPSRHSIRV